MYVHHTSQTGSNVNNQSSFLFLLHVNVMRYVYLLASNGNTTLVFHALVVAIQSDETATLFHTVRINKEEANLATRPEKCLDLSFLNVFSGILIYFPNGNS